jgi:hypothetical protein
MPTCCWYEGATCCSGEQYVPVLEALDEYITSLAQLASERDHIPLSPGLERWYRHQSTALLCDTGCLVVHGAEHLQCVSVVSTTLPTCTVRSAALAPMISTPKMRWRSRSANRSATASMTRVNTYARHSTQPGAQTLAVETDPTPADYCR